MTSMTEDTDIIIKLTKDLKQAVATLTPKEARFLVDCYYQMQDNRIRTAGQIRSMSTEPHAVLDWLMDKNEQLENQLKAALDAFSKSKPMGIWAMSIKGIGPVLSAALLAHVDITKAPTVGHIWRFAGLDPTDKWNKGEKRPWNAGLKVACWKMGESFVKVSGYDDDVYGKECLKRKAYEIRNNDAGKLIDQARQGEDRVDKSTDAWAWYAGCYPAGTSKLWADLKDANARIQLLKQNKLDPGDGQPMLPPGHIQSRAKRYAVKLFLSHWWEEAYKQHFGSAPPLPYPLQFLGHAHKIEPPSFSQVA